MSETKNCKLYTTDDGSEYFIDWRRKMNGTKDSNMTRIDDAMGQKAERSTVVSATLLASAWSGASAPFTQQVSVRGLTANHNGFVFVAQSATANERVQERNARFSVTGQGNGTLTISADGVLPTSDIPLSVILLG